MVKRGRETKPVGELVFDAPNHYYDLRQDSVACEPAKDDASDDDWFNQVHSDHEPSSPIARRRRPLYVPSPERRAAVREAAAVEAAAEKRTTAGGDESEPVDVRGTESAPKTMDSFELHSSLDCSLNQTASSGHLSMMSDGPQIVGNISADMSRDEDVDVSVEEAEEAEEESDADAVDISLDDDIKAMLEAHNKSSGSAGHGADDADADAAKRTEQDDGEIDFLEETDARGAPAVDMDEDKLRRLEKHKETPVARAASAARRRRAAEGPARPEQKQVSLRARATRTLNRPAAPAVPVRPALDDDIAQMLKEHNRGVAKKSHSYVPPAHSIRLIRRWEAEMGAGEKWYTMAPSRREEVNAEITRLVQEGVF